LAQLLVRLSERHQIALLYLRAADEPAIDERIVDRSDVAEEVPRPIAGRSRLALWYWRLRLLTRLACGRPLWVSSWATDSFAARARQLAKTWQPDVAHLAFHIMGQYVSSLEGCPAPRILIDFEAGTRAAPFLRDSPPSIRRLMHFFDRLAWQRFERALLKRVDSVVVFTEGDRRALADLGRTTPIVRISLGTEIAPQPLDPVGRKPSHLLFVGNFCHPPNVDAALRLTDGIFPEVKRHYPDSELWIVGESPPTAIRNRASRSVVVTGGVPDVEPYLDDAAVVVVPLRSGGGMRVKVLEALAAGKALIASPLAVEGLDVTDGRQLLLAETDEEFGKRIVELLGAPARRAELGASARAWACANLGWNGSIEAYEELYAGLAQRSSGSSGHRG
jgi:glycosyltransferase involved in cell wall biosynthesis